MGKGSSSFDRVKAALEHREADRVPFDLGGTNNTGIHRKTYLTLREAIGLPCGGGEVRIEDTIQQLAVVEDEVAGILQSDARSVYCSLPRGSTHYRAPYREGGDDRFTDEWGVGWRKPVEGGLYYDMYAPPLADVTTADELARYPWPEFSDPSRYEEIRTGARRITHEKKLACVVMRPYAGIFETAAWLRGMENFLCDLALDPGFAGSLLDIVLEKKLEFWGRALEAAGENALVAAEADDLAAQRQLLISHDMYRKHVKPRHRKLFDFIRSRARGNIYISFHCCGTIWDIIPDLIECGIDILNPWQVSARGMDTRKFKQWYGRDLTIWGGGCDTQSVLPYGTPEQVREETKRRIDDLAPGGGFVFSAVHNVQADVPVQNFMAMWETWKEYGRYR